MGKELYWIVMKKIPVKFIEIQSKFIYKNLTKNEYKYVDYQFRKKLFYLLLVMFAVRRAKGTINLSPIITYQIIQKFYNLNIEKGSKRGLRPEEVNWQFRNQSLLTQMFSSLVFLKTLSELSKNIFYFKTLGFHLLMKKQYLTILGHFLALYNNQL